MLSDEGFKRGIAVLNAAFPQTIHAGALKMWKELIQEEGIQDIDFVTGIKDCCKGEKYLPAVGIVIGYCNRVKVKRWNDEAIKARAEEKKDQAKVLDKTKASDMGKRSITLINLMLSGKTTTRQNVDYMLKMEEFYSGRGWQHEAMVLKREYENMGLID